MDDPLVAQIEELTRCMPRIAELFDALASRAMAALFPQSGAELCDIWKRLQAGVSAVQRRDEAALRKDFVQRLVATASALTERLEAMQ